MAVLRCEKCGGKYDTDSAPVCGCAEVKEVAKPEVKASVKTTVKP